MNFVEKYHEKTKNGDVVLVRDASALLEWMSENELSPSRVAQAMDFIREAWDETSMFDFKLGTKTGKAKATKDSLSMAEACEYIGVSRPTLGRYVKDGIIPSLKVANRIFIARRELDNFVSNNTKKGA